MARVEPVTERDFYPRFIARPPNPNPVIERDETGRPLRRLTPEEGRARDEAHYAWKHSWQLVYDWSVADWLKKGWECRRVEVGERIGVVSHDDRMAEFEKLADKFLANGGSFAEQVSLEAREAALSVVAYRLKEVAADGFLLKLLIRSEDPDAL